MIRFVKLGEYRFNCWQNLIVFYKRYFIRDLMNCNYKSFLVIFVVIRSTLGVSKFGEELCIIKPDVVFRCLKQTIKTSLEVLVRGFSNPSLTHCTTYGHTYFLYPGQSTGREVGKQSILYYVLTLCQLMQGYWSQTVQTIAWYFVRLCIAGIN